MTAAEVLATHGTKRAAEVVELAVAAKLELAAAATLLEKESGGGRNVWGHDNVDTGGHYVKGAEVTKEAYLNYKADRALGRIGAQGVGPTQLTLKAFQDRADARGGCFDWRVNCSVGFEILAEHIKNKGVHDGFRAYNGSGEAAEAYADDAIKKLGVWRSRLGGSPTPLGEDWFDMATKAELKAALKELLLNDPEVVAHFKEIRDDGVRMLDHGDANVPGHGNPNSKILDGVNRVIRKLGA
jgi:hypothetical protein